MKKNCAFVLLLITILTCCEVYGDKRYPAADCKACTAKLTAPCCGAKLVPFDAWCIGSDITTSVVNSGQTRWVKNTELTENCTDACGNAEAIQPNAITTTVGISVQYTNSVKEVFGSSVSGGTFLAGIQAEVQVEAETQDGYDATLEKSVSVHLPPCTWQQIYAQQQVVEGKQIKSTGTMRPYAIFTCPHGTYHAAFPPQDYTVIVNVDKALESTGTSGTQSNGECPPEEY